MRKIRVLGLLLLVIIVSSFIIGCSSRGTLEKRIVGQWELLGENQGKLYFSEDGKMYARANKIIDTTYEILETNEKKRTIKMKVINPEGKKEMIWFWTFSEDYKLLYLESEEEGEERFRFIDKTQSPY